MNRLIISRNIFIFGSALELTMGIALIVWPFSLIIDDVFFGLNPAVKNLIMQNLLFTGICLMCFAFLSIYFADKMYRSETSAKVFALSQITLWFFRMLIEILFPITAPLYTLTNPSPYIIGASVLMFVLYATPLILIRKQRD
jgi:hypothetical protein